jgi:excisionase family DNA binding protein
LRFFGDGRDARAARSDELTDIGRQFRGKLRELREAERRNQRGRGKRSRVARGRARLQAVESPPADDTLLSPAEVAELLKVTTKTVWRWAQEGLRSTRTIGGHHRYRWGDVTTWLG